MSKINDIVISNFKFFSQEKTIHLGGKHLLLYGENGSGKSSIFWGVYTLLEASYKSSSEIEKYFLPLSNNEESLVNIYAPLMQDVNSGKEHSNSFVKIIDDKSNSFELSLLENKICGNQTAQESRKASDFINYQSIFKFQDFRNSEAPNLYKIFLYSVLPYVSFTAFSLKGKILANAGQMWAEYVNGPGYTTNYKGDKILVYKNSQSYKDFCAFENHFNNQFEELIDFINFHAKERLEKLFYNIDFRLIYHKPSHRKKDKHYEWTPFAIELEITELNGKTVHIKKPHVFFNEAKLSAIAIVIRLTILDYRVNTEAVPNALKVLILDDLMISLDMSNREFVLDMLLNEYVNNYQIIFLTHDKNLYNFVDYKIRQHGQNAQWVRKELYVGEDEIIKQEIPVLIDGECDYFTKAQKYYDVKDYVSSALFVRKSLEKAIGNLLPKEITTKVDGSFVNLQTLWEKLIDFYNNNQKPIDEDTKRLFSDSKLLVLNPSAHFQRLSNPIYRNELTRSFKLYNNIAGLERIEKKLVIEAGKVFYFDYNGYSCSFDLEKDLVVVEGEHLVSVMPKCQNIKWKYQGIDYFDFDTHSQNNFHPLITAKPKLNKFIENLTKLGLGITEEIFLDNCNIGDILLSKYMGGIRISSLIMQSIKI